MQQILKMYKDIFSICQTDLTLVNRYLKIWCFKHIIQRVKIFGNQTRDAVLFTKTALDYESEMWGLSSSLSLTSYISFVSLALKWGREDK